MFFEQIQSALTGYQQVSSHKSAAIHSQTPFMNQKKLRPCQSVRVQRGIKPPEHHCKPLVCFYEIMTNDDQQRTVRCTSTTQHHPLSVGLYLYPFQNHMFSQASTLAKTSHALYPGCFLSLFLAKHPSACLLQQKHPLIRQFPEEKSRDTTESPRNHKFCFRMCLLL